MDSALHGVEKLNSDDRDFVYRAYSDCVRLTAAEKLKVVLAAVELLDDDAQKVVLEELGRVCYQFARKSFEPMGWHMVTSKDGRKLTLQEAAEEICVREMSNNGCRRDFETIIDGRTVTVHRQEYECFADGDDIIAICGIGRLNGPGAHCSCTLKKIITPNIKYCSYCMKGHFGKMYEEAALRYDSAVKARRAAPQSIKI